MNLQIGNFKSKHKVQNFKLVVTTLKVAARGVIENYPLGSGGYNNHDLINNYLSPKLAAKLKSDVRAAFRFLEKLDSSQQYRLRHFKPWAKKFYKWQKRLLTYHLRSINQGKSLGNVGLNTGLCLHYLFDNLYHLFKTFLSTMKDCPWCSCAFVGRGTWDLQYELTLTFFIPGIYQYLRAAQSAYIGKKKPSNQELVEGLSIMLDCVSEKIQNQ